jgi:hypothetical protein
LNVRDNIRMQSDTKATHRHRQRCNFECVRLSLIASPLLVVTMIAAGAVAATPTKGPTEMYRGTKKIAQLIPAQIGQHRAETWNVDCEGSPFVTRGRSARERRRINVHHWDGAVDGYALRQTSGRWRIYYWYPPKVAWFAVRRSATRWDVLRGQRKIGYTIGPDGPAAASALVIAC